MKYLSILILSFLTTFVAKAQCAFVAISVSSSDTSYAQLYHPGFFNMPSGFANSCEWEIRSFSGQVIHRDTTSGNFSDQGFMLFEHSTPISDSMEVTLVITNEIEGIICTVQDTLFWEEIEVLPGAFIGNWAILSSNGGVEEDISTSTEELQFAKSIELFPSPSHDFFSIKGIFDLYSFSIFDINGRILASHKNFDKKDKIDISAYRSGVYFVQFWDADGKKMVIKRVVKI